MKNIIGILIIVAGFLGGLYIGLWMMFIQSIVDLCISIDKGMISATAIGTTVLKCIFAGPIGYAIVYIGFIIGGLFLGIEFKSRRRKRRRYE